MGTSPVAYKDVSKKTTKTIEDAAFIHVPGLFVVPMFSC